MNFGRITIQDCVNVVPPPDSRCSDPAFALANPDICPAQTLLVIKPAVAIACVFGSIQFKAFTVKNGVETEVTDSTIFSTSDLDIAPVGVISGNATGLSPGVATITATYEGSTATAEMTILDCANGDDCSTQHVAMMVVVDNSRSMTMDFAASGYPTRLDYAKAAATQFISEVNANKDYVGLIRFNAASYSVLSSPSSDTATVESLVATIPSSQQKTSFYDALSAAITELEAITVDRRVIVLMSDGESTAGTDSGDENPYSLLSNFKAAGGIVICLGIRASGTGFAALSAFSTGGFLVNAYNTTAAATLTYLSGLKGYICAGNCTPEGDEIVSVGTLNYTGFVNWDVIGGYVDLQGNGFFDYLPGNGMYVDLISGMQPSGVANGKLQTKSTFSVVSGQNYRLTVALSGNQQISRTDKVIVRVFYLNNDPGLTPIYLLNQIVTLSDFTQDFHNYSLSFTPVGNHDVYVSIEQESVPTSAPMAGVLLNSVKLENLSTLTILLDDDFDEENLSFVPPACGQSSLYATVGYNCYGDGCLDEPIPVQLPDPSPLSNIESGTPPPDPVTYTSIKEECVSCEGGSEDIGENLVPLQDGTGTDAIASSEATTSGITDYAWQAFDGDDTTKWTSDEAVPQWISIDMGAATAITWYSLTCVNSSRPTAWKLQGSSDSSTWNDLDSQDDAALLIPFADTKFKLAAEAEYRYYRVYITAVSNSVTPPGGSPIARVALLEIGLYITAVEEKCATATETSTVSQADADYKASEAAIDAATALLNCPHIFTSTQQYTLRCPAGTLGQDVIGTGSATSTVSQDNADEKAVDEAIADANSRLVCTSENVNQAITINDCAAPGVAAAATPYPSVKYVSGLTGTVTNVVVAINGLTHSAPQDILMLLKAPSGETVILMANCGGMNSISEVNITFEDGQPNMTGALIVDGAYAPTQIGGYLQLPSPAPDVTYGTALSEFAGIDPNGAWSLWVADDGQLDTGEIVGIPAWDLTITTA